MAAVFVFAAAGWVKWLTSPMREIERSRAAVARAKSWHYQKVRINPSAPELPPEAIDQDTFCPSYQRTVQSGVNSNGAPVTFDYINFRGRVYGRSGDRWLASPGRQADMNAQGSIPIFECLKGTLGADGNSLPYEAIIAGGDAKRGRIRDVGGASCRDYEIRVPILDLHQ